MALLGVVRTRSRQGVVFALVFLPVVGVAIANLVTGWGFDPHFVVLYQALVLVVGGVAGLPLYLYGRILRDDNSQGVQR
jgi:hypothetical protein